MRCLEVAGSTLKTSGFIGSGGGATGVEVGEFALAIMLFKINSH
jgi:hypothetical protein